MLAAKPKNAGIERPIRLASNESALGPSAKAMAAYGALAGEIHRYPDGSAQELREALGRHHGLDPARIVCGAGSDELIALLLRCLCRAGRRSAVQPPRLPDVSDRRPAVGATPVAAPERELTTDVDALLARVTERTRIVFVANPNNPTGTYLGAEEMARLHAGLPPSVLLAIDAAYAEFVNRNDYEARHRAGGSSRKCRDVADIFEDLCARRRCALGWAYCPPAIADLLNRVRSPFNVSAPRSRPGIAAVEDVEALDRARAHNERWLPWFSERLTALGIPLTPSVANFVLARFPDEPRKNADAAFAFLQSRGILTRKMGAYGLPQHLRITIGTGREEMEAAWRARMLGENSWRAMSATKLFDRVALIGIGLIGSSLARRIAPRQPRHLASSLAPGVRRPWRRCAGWGSPTRPPTTRRRRPRAPIWWSSRPRSRPMTKSGGKSAPALKAGCDPHRCRLGQAGGDPRPAAACAGRRPFRSRPSGRRDRAFRARNRALPSCFASRWCILTPLPETAPEAVAAVGRMWERFGMRVVTMSADHHDKVLAMTSHLPHLIAYTIVGTATNLEESLKSEVIEFSASGFRDFTRIAASDPVMWRDIFLNNREAVLEIVQRFTEDLTALQRAIRWGEGDKLQELFTRTRAIRRSIIEAKQA